MKRNNVMIPKPRSNFLSVQCEQCGEKRTIFSHSTVDINCSSCNSPLAARTGAKAIIKGKLLNVLDS